MEKNLALKAKHGAAPIEPPQPASILGKAKKLANQKSEEMMAAAR